MRKDINATKVLFCFHKTATDLGKVNPEQSGCGSFRGLI